jgi:hypothetical protein
MASHRFATLNGQDLVLFNCGLPEPARYLREHAAKDMARGWSITVVAAETQSVQVAGFYTLAPAVVQYSHSANRQARVVVLKHLAYDINIEGPELGTALLADARRRAARPGVGADIMVVETQSELHSTDFARFGFTRDPVNPRRLFGRIVK